MPGGIATPQAIARPCRRELRQVGMSRQKSAYLRDLAAKVASGELPLDSLSEMTDDEVIEAITKVKGLGRWSAEMFLMFRLHRPDVLPVDDLGIVNAIQRLYRLRKKPSADRIRKIGEAGGRIAPSRAGTCGEVWRTRLNETTAADCTDHTDWHARHCDRRGVRLRARASRRTRNRPRKRTKRSGTSPPISARPRSWRSTRPKGRG